MATISYIKPASIIIDPSKRAAAPAQAEELDTTTSVAMQGLLTISIIAPADDQLLFKLVPEADRQNLLKKIWIQSTLQALQMTVNQLVEQALVQTRLYPVTRQVQPSFAGDAKGNLIYVFQVPVATFPPQPQSENPSPVFVSDPGPIAPLAANDHPEAI
jgi:hypothetical protein